MPFYFGKTFLSVTVKNAQSAVICRQWRELATDAVYFSLPRLDYISRIDFITSHQSEREKKCEDSTLTFTQKNNLLNQTKLPFEKSSSSSKNKYHFIQVFLSLRGEIRSNLFALLGQQNCFCVSTSYYSLCYEWGHVSKEEQSRVFNRQR